MKTRPYLMHALSPLHAGTGQSVEVIDLPIARMKATGIPYVPGSSVKGVLRWTRREQLDEKNSAISRDEFFSTFGPDTEHAAEHAGALMVGDARLLLLAVRSFVGTFAYVTSPLLLSLAARDLEAMPGRPAIPTLDKEAAARTPTGSVNVHKGKVFLEDLDLSASPGPETDAWANFLAPHLASGSEQTFTRRFLIVDDESMAFLWETATQVDARIRLDPVTRTVADGALWYEESLPPESVLIGLLMATRGMRPRSDKNGGKREAIPFSPEEVLEVALSGEEILQFGGKASVGRGRSRLIPLR